MLDVMRALVSNVLVKGFGLAVENRDKVHADLLMMHALVRHEFGDVSLEDGLSRIRAEPTHRLRNLVAWVDGPRLVKMSAADEYREASAGMNRLALTAQQEPTLNNIIAWWLAGGRFARAQQAYALSKPAEPTKRNPRVKAAVALKPQDFSPEAQAAIVELSIGDTAKGRRALEAMVGGGNDPGGHIFAILCKVNDDHWEDLNTLARQIARQGGTAFRTVAEAAPAAVAPEPAAAEEQVASESVGSEPADDAAMAEAVATLVGWVDRAWEFIGQKFRKQDGLWIFRGPITNRAAETAYPIAGRSPAFQAILRERLGDPA